MPFYNQTTTSNSFHHRLNGVQAVKCVRFLVQVLLRIQCLLFPFLLPFILSNFLFEGEICSGKGIDNVEWLCWCLLVACLSFLFSFP